MSWNAKRRQLLAGAAFLPLAWAEPAQAETICSQAPDGTVSCVDGSTVVATGTAPIGTVTTGPGLQIDDVDVYGSLSGDVTTTSDSTPALNLSGYFSVSFKHDGTIVTQGDGSPGFRAVSLEGFAIIETGDVFTSGDGSVGVGTGGFDGGSVTCTSVTTTGANSLGIAAGGSSFSSSGSVSCGDVSATGAGSGGIRVHGGGASAFAANVTSNSTGIWVSGGLYGSSARVDRVITTGSDADGIYLDSQDGDGTVQCGSVATQGDRSIGLHLAGKTLAVICGDIQTAGAQSTGVNVADVDAADLTLGDVTTTGDNSPAVEVTAFQSATAAVGNVTTSGDSAEGIRITAGGFDEFGDRYGSADLTCGDVTTTGASSDAVILSAQEATAHCGDIVATGAGSRGVIIDAQNSTSTWGDITSDFIGLATSGQATVGHVTTFGDGGTGIRLSNENGGASVDCRSVTTYGDNASGIASFAYQGGNGVTCGDIRTEGDHSLGADLTETGFRLGNIKTLGFESWGVGAGGFIFTDGIVGNISTAGDYSLGIRIETAELGLTAGNISTGGNNSSAAVFNITSRGAFNIALGDIKTLGNQSIGISLTGDGGGTLTAGNISTLGAGAAALQASVTDASLDFSVGNVTTAGPDSPAIKLSTGIVNTTDADVVLTSGDVATSGDNSPAIAIDADGAVRVTTGDVTTLGANSSAIDIRSGGPSYYDDPYGDIELTCGDVSTSGAASGGIQAIATGFEGAAEISCGNVTATGAGSFGVRAFANMSADVTVGNVLSSGEGIAAGVGEGGVTVRAGNVTTTGNDAGGIYGNAGDGGGSINCGSVTTLGQNSVGVWGTASDGRIGITCGSVRTEGDDSIGVVQQSDGLISVGEVMTLGDRSDGVSMSSLYGSVAELGSVTTFGANSAGISSYYSGFTGVTADSVTTNGDDSVGILIRPDGDVDLNVGQITTSGAGSHGIDVTTDGYVNNITLNLGGVEVTGANADAIRIWSPLDSPSSVAIDLTSSGDIRSADGTAISVATLQDFDLAVLEGTEISGRAGGIVVDAASINLDIAGAVAASEGPAIHAAGGPASVEIAESGSLNGFMTFGSGGDVVNNAGLFTTSGLSDFGAGVDRLTNSGILVVKGQAAFRNLERFENNGTIDMQDGAPDDRLQISGDYVGRSNAAVALDVSRALDHADVLAIGGDISGQTLLSIDWIDSTAPVNAGGVLLVEGAADAQAFTVEGLEDFGLFALTLRERDGDLYLMAAIDPAAADMSVLGILPSESWYQSFDAVLMSVAGRNSMLPKLGFWAQGYGGTDRIGGKGLADLFGMQVAASNRLESNRAGGQIGFDGTFGPVVVGLTAGYERSESDAGFASDADAKGFNIGAYAGFGAARGPYAITTIKYDRLKIDFDSSSGSLVVPKLDASSAGGDVEVGWRGSLELASLDVHAGVSAVHSRIDDFAIDGSTFDPHIGTSIRGRLGGRLTLASPLQPFAEARLFHEFGHNPGLRIISGSLGAEVDGPRRGTWGRIEAGIGGGISRSLLSAWADVGDRRGIGLRAGFRF